MFKKKENDKKSYLSFFYQNKTLFFFSPLIIRRKKKERKKEKIVKSIYFLPSVLSLSFLKVNERLKFENMFCIVFFSHLSTFTLIFLG